MTKLVLPQISINGSSKGRLVEQQLVVFEGLRSLIGKMSEAAPHGRDYQFRPSEYSKARDAWLERMKVVEDLQKEIETHALAIHDIA